MKSIPSLTSRPKFGRITSHQAMAMALVLKAMIKMSCDGNISNNVCYLFQGVLWLKKIASRDGCSIMVKWLEGTFPHQGHSDMLP